MRKLILFLIAAAALSKLSFGRVVPPELRVRARGFDALEEQPYPHRILLDHPGGSGNGINR